MIEHKDPNPKGQLDEFEIIVMAEDSVMYESPYLGQHGISMLARATGGGVTRHILMDVGQNPTGLLHNFRQMNIDPACIDAIIITHCHYDHTQGLAEIVAAIGKKDLPVIAHPAMFRLNFITAPFLRHVGVMSGDSEDKLRAAGAELYLVTDPLELMPGLFTTGEVKRQTDYEEVGIGGLATIEDGKVKADSMPDDMSIVARVRGHAPIVMTGCSHAGIVNIVKQVSSMCGTHEFENVMGGFHLIEASENRIKKTVAGLSEYQMKAIMPGHCTGFRAQAAMYAAFGKVFTPLQTGMRIKVSAGHQADH
ncbi:MAG TPA: MBL fold metallo-hydrolase [bacterium]|nr:MBL fold metallo-hydrolase [bacterium]